MEDRFLIKPSSQEVFVGANQKAYQNYTKNQHQKTNEDDNSLKYLPKMHNVYRLSSTERSYLDLYGNTITEQYIFLKVNMFIFIY